MLIHLLHSRAHRLERIVIPSVVVPIGCLVIIIAIILCCRRSRRKEQRQIGSPTPSSFAGMNSPHSPATFFGAGSGNGPFASHHPGYAYSVESEAAVVVIPGFMGERRKTPSQESFATSPSAIGVAVGDGGYGSDEPRTNWGRRSLHDVIAGGAAASQLADSQNAPQRPRPDTFNSTSSSFVAGRQPSLASMRESIDAGVGGYNSLSGYRPGQMRPVHSPQGSGQFDNLTGTVGTAYATEHGIRPVSDSEWTDSQPTDSFYAGTVPRPDSEAYEGIRSPLSDLTEDDGPSSLDGEPATSAGSAADPRAAPYSLGALHEMTQSQQTQYEDAHSTQSNSNFDDADEGEGDEGDRLQGLSGASSPQVAAVNFGSSSSSEEGGGLASQTTPRVGEEGTPRAQQGPVGATGGKDGAWW